VEAGPTSHGVASGSRELVTAPLVPRGAPTFPNRQRVDLGQLLRFFSCVDELGEYIGANPAGHRRLSEAAIRVEDHRDVAAHREQPLGDVAAGEVRLLEERGSRVSDLERAVTTEDNDAELGIEADDLLHLERQFFARGRAGAWRAGTGHSTDHAGGRSRGGGTAG
jgi:hypothetical protein